MKATLIVAMIVGVFASIPAQASTIDVRVLSAAFSATVRVDQFYQNAETRSSTDSNPVSESFAKEFIPEDPEWGTWGFAQADASAGFVDLVAIGLSFGTTNAYAYADSEWTFSPMTDGTADFDIYMSGLWIGSNQSASLFDVTADQQVWQFSATSLTSANEAAPTFLSAQHVYALHLSASAVGLGDGTWSYLNVSGIQAVQPQNRLFSDVIAVPDTGTTFLLLAAALCVCWIFYRFQRSLRHDPTGPR